MVELRKRKAPAEAAPPPPAKKSTNPVKKAIDTVKEAVTGDSGAATNGTAKIAVGQTIALDGFGGELETHTGDKVTLSKLLEQSQGGVVLFTYPKASTPGCTTQACLFRDNYSPITSAGLSVYGLSTDSPNSNTKFATKQSLPFPLLCDPSATLISAIGMKKAPKSTTRGVVVIDKEGKVKVWEQAGPQKTVDAVMGYVQTAGSGTTSAPPPPAPASDTTMADAPSAAEPAVGTDTAPATNAEVPPAAPSSTDAEQTAATGLLPASSTSAAFAQATPESATLLSKEEEPAKMDEVPLTKEASAEEVKAAETAAEVGETAAKIDSAEEVKT